MARRRSSFSAPVVAATWVALLVAVGVLGARQLGWLERLELAALDHHARLTARGPAADPRVALVEVSEEDIQTLGSYPIPDGILALAIQLLTEHGARAIGIDIYRDISVEPGSERLAEVFANNPRVVFISKVSDGTSPGVAPPPALAGTQQVGFNNVISDRDGIVRRGLLFMDDDEGGVAYSFPLLLALLYLGDEGIQATGDPHDPELLRLGAITFRGVSKTTGSYVTPAMGGYQFLIDAPTTARAFESASLRELLSGGERVSSMFRDRIAIVGLTADSVPDLFNVGFEMAPGGSHIPGAVLHAHLASQLVRHALGEGGPIETLSDAQEALLVIACAVLGAAAGLWTRSIWRIALFGGVALAALWAAGWASLAAGWWIPVVPAAAACLTSGAAVTAFLASREKAERAELMQLFSRHVTKQVAEEIWRKRDEYLEGGRPKPERLTATILFVDMKGYTSRAEKMDVQDLMVWINEYLRALSQDVLDCGGLVEDYFGDGVMACFGMPIARHDIEGFKEDACNAVGCALQMENSVRQLNAKWGEDGYPTIGVRVGICTGVVVAGSLGSEERLKYGVVGDVVVTAQRLQGLDDERHDFAAEPCRILISGQTREYLGDRFRTREFGEVLLKGKSEPLLVHRVLGHAEGDSRLSSPAGGEAR